MAATWRQATGDPVDQIFEAGTVSWSGSAFVLAAITKNPETGRGDGLAFWTASPDGSAWVLGDERSGGWVNDFAYTSEGGGVAVGYRDTTGAAWTSADGLTWTPAPDQAAFRPRSGEEAVVLGQVARGPGGYVAIGYTMPLAEKALLFRSADGVTWTRESRSGVRFDGIAADGVRYLLAGHLRGTFKALFWTSEDGRTWTEAAPPPGADPAVEGSFDVDAGPAGWLITRSAGQPGTQAAWWSADGLAWTQGTTPDGDLVPTYEDAAVATPTGFVADAWSEACTGGLWLSGDATTWACIENAPVRPHPNRTFAASADAVVSVDPDGTTWVATLGR